MQYYTCSCNNHSAQASSTYTLWRIIAATPFAELNSSVCVVRQHSARWFALHLGLLVVQFTHAEENLCVDLKDVFQIDYIRVIT